MKYNTKIDYKNKDKNNFQTDLSVVLPGQITEPQIQEILNACYDQEYFIPEYMGFPAQKDWAYDPISDTPFWRLTRQSFTLTEDPVTIQIQIPDLIHIFGYLKNNWAVLQKDYPDIHPLNTQLDYLYRDDSNYKSYASAVINGLCTAEQIQKILSACYNQEYFIPEHIGLPAERNWDYDETVDDSFWELTPASFSITLKDYNTDITPEFMTARFQALKDSWEDLDARYPEL